MAAVLVVSSLAFQLAQWPAVGGQAGVRRSSAAWERLPSSKESLGGGEREGEGKVTLVAWMVRSLLSEQLIGQQQVGRHGRWPRA